MNLFINHLHLIVPILLVVFLGTVVGHGYRVFSGARKLLQHGSLRVPGRVVSCSPTGATVNSRPEMLVVVELENRGGSPRRVEVRQVPDPGRVPRVGDRVYVFSDPANPANLLLAPAGPAG